MAEAVVDGDQEVVKAVDGDFAAMIPQSMIDVGGDDALEDEEGVQAKRRVDRELMKAPFVAYAAAAKRSAGVDDDVGVGRWHRLLSNSARN